jgi:hypothetical protein
MFAKQIQKDVKVGDETVTVRKLSGKTLNAARASRRAEQVQSMRDIGADLIKAFREGRDVAKEEREAAKVAATAPADPTPDMLAKARKATFDDYDRDVVLVAGIVRWTAKTPCTPENIGDLDEESRLLLSDEILDLSVAPINIAEVQGKG